jgi:histidinol-phosphate/aromatic aminotransferase/cobyric acid decarboxylase-like protein
VRYWGSRPELASKLRVTVGTKESVDKFVAICKEALPSLP